MLTTAVVSILVVQNSLLCDRKLQELKKAKIIHISCISTGLRVKKGPNIFLEDKSTFFVCV